MSETEIFLKYKHEGLRELLDICLKKARKSGKDESTAYVVFREITAYFNKSGISNITEEEVSKLIVEYESKKENP